MGRVGGGGCEESGCGIQDGVWCRGELALEMVLGAGERYLLVFFEKSRWGWSRDESTARAESPTPSEGLLSEESGLVC